MTKIETTADAYFAASGGSSMSRAVKARIYGIGKLVDNSGDHAGSAPALTAGVAAIAENAGLVPQKAQVRAQVDRPINNMGENLADGDDAVDVDTWASIFDEDLGEVSLVMTDSGKTKTVMVRKPSTTQACIVDWINFTVLEDTFFKTARQTLVADEQIYSGPTL